MRIIIIALIALLTSCYVFAAPQDHGVDYDIVYVRYPAVDPGDNFVTINQAENPYDIAAGADLMLLHPDGSEEVLVDCTTCSVIDPSISFDGRYVYYSRVDNVAADGVDSGTRAGSFIYKIDLQASAPRPQIQLTFNDGFETGIASSVDMSGWRKLRDMSPFPMSGGKIGFVSNRSGLIPFNNRLAERMGSTLQIYVMDDHDGSKNTAALSNLHRIDNSSISMAQNPTQLKDGRIAYASWQDVAMKERYGMTALFTMNPDGSNVMQFTEPHVRSKYADRIVTQLPDDQLVWSHYYPTGTTYGFGVLLRAPLDPAGIDFFNQSVSDPAIEGTRHVERTGTVNITGFTAAADQPAPTVVNPSDSQTYFVGKFSNPSYATSGNLLASWSTSSTNWFGGACSSNCDPLESGIALIKNVATAEMSAGTDIFDETKIVMIHDNASYNEIMPRAVVSFQSQYGIAQPASIEPTETSPEDSRLARGEAAAFIGTSSMILKDPLESTAFQEPTTERSASMLGNWRVRGGEAGVFDEGEIYGVRIIGTPPKHYAGVLSGSQRTEINDYLRAPTGLDLTRRYGGLHNEKWEILGEFILPHTASTNSRGKKDTSWIAKVPSDTPFLIQTLDSNGMTMVSEHTWRALKPGEKRADCGGCHNHTQTPLDYTTTASGQLSTIANIPGVSNADERISEGYFDLTSGVPMLDSTGMSFTSSGAVTVEWNNDVLPIINNRCVSCHTSGQTNGGLVLDTSTGSTAWAELTDKNSCPAGECREPQRSKYIRVPQARESLFIWKAWNARLDGRLDGDRADDVDFGASHDVAGLTDTERRTLARWVDLGSPVDLTVTDGAGYRDDSQAPTIAVDISRGQSRTGGRFRVGARDAKSGVDWSTLSVQYSTTVSNSPVWNSVSLTGITPSADGVVVLPSIKEANYILRVSVDDVAGNTAVYESTVETQALNAQGVSF